MKLWQRGDWTHAAVVAGATWLGLRLLRRAAASWTGPLPPCPGFRSGSDDGPPKALLLRAADAIEHLALLYVEQGGEPIRLLGHLELATACRERAAAGEHER